MLKTLKLTEYVNLIVTRIVDQRKVELGEELSAGDENGVVLNRRTIAVLLDEHPLGHRPQRVNRRRVTAVVEQSVDRPEHVLLPTGSTVAVAMRRPGDRCRVEVPKDERRAAECHQGDAHLVCVDGQLIGERRQEKFDLGEVLPAHRTRRVDEKDDIRLRRATFDVRSLQIKLLSFYVHTML